MTADGYVLACPPVEFVESPRPHPLPLVSDETTTLALLPINALWLPISTMDSDYRILTITHETVHFLLQDTSYMMAVHALMNRQFVCIHEVLEGSGSFSLSDLGSQPYVKFVQDVLTQTEREFRDAQEIIAWAFTMALVQKRTALSPGSLFDHFIAAKDVRRGGQFDDIIRYGISDDVAEYLKSTILQHCVPYYSVGDSKWGETFDWLFRALTSILSDAGALIDESPNIWYAVASRIARYAFNPDPRQLIATVDSARQVHANGRYVEPILEDGMYEAFEFLRDHRPVFRLKELIVAWNELDGNPDRTVRGLLHQLDQRLSDFGSAGRSWRPELLNWLKFIWSSAGHPGCGCVFELAHKTAAPWAVFTDIPLVDLGMHGSNASRGVAQAALAFEGARQAVWTQRLPSCFCEDAASAACNGREMMRNFASRAHGSPADLSYRACPA